MKKAFFFSLFLLIVSATVMAQDNSTKIEHLNYDGFINKVWDLEKTPNKVVYKGKVPAIVDFYANWCGPCRRVAPIMEKLADEYEGRLVIYKINVDEEKTLSSAFNIYSIPTVLFIPMEGKPFVKVGAMSEADYRKAIEELLLK